MNKYFLIVIIFVCGCSTGDKVKIPYSTVPIIKDSAKNQNIQISNDEVSQNNEVATKPEGVDTEVQKYTVVFWSGTLFNGGPSTSN